MLKPPPRLPSATPDHGLNLAALNGHSRSRVNQSTILRQIEHGRREETLGAGRLNLTPTSVCLPVVGLKKLPSGLTPRLGKKDVE